MLLKKIYSFTAVVILAISFAAAYYQSVCGEFVRFRVIANSDSPYDQLMKIKLKNEILDYLKDGLKACGTKEETIAFLNGQSENVKRKAEDFLKREGVGEAVSVSFSNHFCPAKKYSGFKLPEGNYDCFEIKIGGGRGKNFFCVMFPPACVCKEMTGSVAGKLNNKKIIYRFKIINIFTKENNQ